jgi:uncharacterized protein
MIRLLFYAVLIYLGYRILKPWVASLLGGSQEDSSADASLEEAELIRDPQCGTYFLRQRGVGAKIGGRTVYFCSTECRDKYLVNHTDD